MTKYDIQIFAEIVDASALSRRGDPRARARTMRSKRRQCDRSRLPARHAVPASRGGRSRALKDKGYKVSVDFADPDELLRGGKAGADFLLSLNEDTLHVADRGRLDAGADPQGPRRPGLALPRHGCARCQAAAPISPIPCSTPSISASWSRSSAMPELRRERPDAEMLMGTGNLTELTDADTTGITAMLLGIASELAHQERARGAGEPAYAPHRSRSTISRGASCLPAAPTTSCRRTMPTGCSALHARKPFPQTPEEIAESRARGARQEFPHRDRRGRHPCL